MSVKAKAISAVQQQDGLIMAQIQRKQGMVGREASLLRGVLRSGRAEIEKGIESALVLFEEKGSFDPPLMLGENLERV
jgi:hypothetical protein